MFLLLLACAQLPEDPAELYGLWTNTDDAGLVRVLEFAEAIDDQPELDGASTVYRFWNYPEGDEPAVAQVGSYGISYEHIVTTPLPDAGVAYSNMMLGFRSDRWLELEIDKVTGDSRVYDLTDALP